MVNISKYENVTERAIQAILTRSIPQPDGCILWPGTCSPDGYGMSGYRGAASKKYSIYVHRAIYVRFVGPIPVGMEVDHRCHDPLTCLVERGRDCPHRRCINIAHLQLLTPMANTRRSRPCVKTTCPAGHEYDTGKTGRNCKRCNAEHKRRELARRRDQINARRRLLAARRRDASRTPEAQAEIAAISRVMGMLASGAARRAREHVGLSQRALAEICGTKQSVIAGWEANQRRPTGPNGARYASLIEQYSTGSAPGPAR